MGGSTKLLLKYMENKSKMKPRSAFLSKLQASTGLLNISDNIYECSLLTAAPPLAFMLAYGFTQMIYFRWLDAGFEDTTSMGFGQITPLFLLVLPILAAAEIYYGMCPQQRHEVLA
jgi:hypothetical protein